MTSRHRLLWFVLCTLILGVGAYHDHGDATLPKVEVHIPTIPHHLQPDHASATGPAQSLISAIVPLVTEAPHGGRQTLYSMYYNRGAIEAQQRVGKGLFKRGVFADDPPFPTCRQCDIGGAGNFTRPFSSWTASSGEPECKTIPYNGVFRTADPRSKVYCFDSSYSGIFSTTQPYSFSLPCCVTTPESCLANRTTSTTSYSFTTGVFVTSTTYVSNSTVSTYIVPSSSSTLSSLSGSLPGGSDTLSGSGGQSPGLGSGSTTRTGLSYSGSLTGSSSTSSGQSTLTTTSRGSQSSASTTSFSVIVISSTTITLSAPTTSATTSNSVITVYTLTTTTTSLVSVTPAPTSYATLIGCGTVTSGSGTVNGSGTVLPAGFPFVPVTSIGVASGYAPLVIGCGVLIGTGTFTGTASITGCGIGNGTATLTGEGTVWPDILGRPQTTLSFTSSGIISGQGRVKGCGTLTGSGTFTVSDQPSPTLTSTRTRSLIIVETYVSYCGPATSVLVNGGAFPNLKHLPALNDTSIFNASAAGVRPASDPESSWHNDTLPFNPLALYNSTPDGRNATNNSSSDTDDRENPNCISCPNSGGICCPKDTPCDARGKCPWPGIVAMGYVRHGFNMVMATNMSDGTKIGDGGITPEAAGLGGVKGEEAEVLAGLMAGRVGGGGAGGVAGGRVAPHPMGGDVGSVLAKRERDEREKREWESKDLMERGSWEGRHDFVVRGDA